MVDMSWQRKEDWSIHRRVNILVGACQANLMDIAGKCRSMSFVYFGNVHIDAYVTNVFTRATHRFPTIFRRATVKRSTTTAKEPHPAVVEAWADITIVHPSRELCDVRDTADVSARREGQFSKGRDPCMSCSAAGIVS